MAALNDFKTFMAAKLGQILCKEISPNEITLGTPSASSNPAKRRLPIEYKGKFYPVIYEPFDIARLFSTTQPQFTTNAKTIHEIVDLLNSRYGIGLNRSEVLDGPIEPVTRVTILDTSLQWRGALDVKVTLTVVVGKPLHEFILNGSDVNTGTSTAALALPVTYEVVGSKKYAVRKNGGVEPLGVTLPMSGDYVLDVEVLPQGTGDNNVLFASSAGGPQGISVGAFMIGNDRRFYHGHLSTLGVPVAGRPQMSATVPTRLTIRSLNGELTVYQNAVEITRFRPPTTIANYDVFGSSTFVGWVAPNKMRALRYWDTAMDQDEFDSLLNPLYNITKPLHEFLFNGNAKNTGTSGTDMTTPLSYGEAEGGTYAYLNSSVPVSFGNGLNMSVSGDYTYDFVVMFNTIPLGYYCLFNTSSGTNDATGAFYFWFGKHYEYRVSPGAGGMANVDSPVVGKPYRITICSRGGITRHYVNGKFTIDYTSPSGGRVLDRWMAPGYGWPANAGIGYVKMWDSGLSDAELAILFAN